MAQPVETTTILNAPQNIDRMCYIAGWGGGQKGPILALHNLWTAPKVQARRQKGHIMFFLPFSCLGYILEAMEKHLILHLLAICLGKFHLILLATCLG